MNYPSTAIVDTDALMIALAHQTTSLPEKLQQQLIQTGPTFLENQPEAAHTLRELIRSYPPLETEYFNSIKKWAGEYASQERAKSLNATFQTTQGFGFIFSHDILPSPDWVRAAQQLAQQQRRQNAEQPAWIQRGNSIVSMISGGAFLGVLLGQLPGAIVGAVVGAIVAWSITEPKKASQDLR